MLKYLFALLFIIIPIYSHAQPGYIKRVAGNMGAGYSGDGGPATNAMISWPKGIATDPWGSFYIHDGGNGRIRKVTPDGIITTVAGGGTSTADGILAVNASLYASPFSGIPGGVAIDHSGNIILVDGGRVRKVTASTGIITTIATMDVTDLYIDAVDNIYAANGIYIRKITPAGVVSIVAGISPGGFSGDGGPATAASLNGAAGICGDAAGNLYISDKGNNRIRKISSSGIISTIAGTGATGLGGDGGPATAALMDQPLHIRMDSHGNLFFADFGNDRIRKISNTGTISTVAGGGGVSPTPSGVPATNSYLLMPTGVGIDAADNMYVTDQGQDHAFMFDNIGGTSITSSTGSFSVYSNFTCSNVEFTIAPTTYSPSLTVKTWFGDGSVQTNSFIYSGSAWVSHTYSYPATFTVKHVLYNGASPVDSISYPYTYQFCRSIPLRVFVDNNSNCVYDNTIDGASSLPIRLAIDSSGTAIDTIPCIGAMYYNARGPLGTVYTFKPINIPPGVVVSCPSSGVLSHTLSSYANTPAAYIGLNCSTAPGYDLRLFTDLRAGANRADFLILADNLYCMPPFAIISMGLNAKYDMLSAVSHSASSASSSHLQWNVNTLSSVMSSPYTIRGSINRNLAITVSSGDTMRTDYNISPLSADANPADNVIIRVDTIKKSYDPNDISVLPAGCLTTQLKLTYTIRFENTGTDTAFHIYVLDTLPAELDVKSIRIEATSDPMSTYIKKIGAYNILRFDFPNINLPDSSQHGLNTGMVVYSINRNPSLPEGTHIRNRVGIYFDDNPPVLTNTAENTIGCPITSVNEVTQQGRAEVFPNPATNELFINAPGAIYTTCTITNSIGQVMLRQELLNPRTKLNIVNLPAGIYYVTLRGAQTEVHKVVKL